MLNGIADTKITLICFSSSVYRFSHDKELRLAVLEGSTRFEYHNPVTLQFMLRLAIYTNLF